MKTYPRILVNLTGTRTEQTRHPNIKVEKMTATITRLPSKRRWTESRMHQFQCGHQECFSQFSSPNKDDLMRQVAEHLREVHNVERATQTLLRYLEATCVTSQP